MQRTTLILFTFFLFSSFAYAQYSTPVRIIEQPVQTQSSKQVINLVEQIPIGPGSAVTLPETLITVPSGTRLVITSAAVDTGLNSCSFTLNPRIRIARPSSPNLVMFPLGRVTASVFGTSPANYVNQMTYPVVILAEPGDIVSFDLFRNSTACVSLVRLSISGYLEEDN